MLRDVQAGDRVAIFPAKVGGTLDMDAATIGRDLFMRDGQFEQGIKLFFAHIGGNLDVRGATLADLDLSGTRIDGELRLGSPSHPLTWSAGAGLMLRNASAEALQDEPGAWPDRRDLDGFTHRRLGGFEGDSGSPADRGSQWYIEWLAKDRRAAHHGSR